MPVLTPGIGNIEVRLPDPKDKYELIPKENSLLVRYLNNSFPNQNSSKQNVRYGSNNPLRYSLRDELSPASYKLSPSNDRSSYYGRAA